MDDTTKPAEANVGNVDMRAELNAATTQNLLGLETYAMPYGALGVPILRAYTYELIQILNHVWLADRLKGNPTDV